MGRRRLKEQSTCFCAPTRMQHTHLSKSSPLPPSAPTLTPPLHHPLPRGLCAASHAQLQRRLHRSGQLGRAPDLLQRGAEALHGRHAQHHGHCRDLGLVHAHVAPAKGHQRRKGNAAVLPKGGEDLCRQLPRLRARRARVQRRAQRSWVFELTVESHKNSQDPCEVVK